MEIEKDILIQDLIEQLQELLSIEHEIKLVVMSGDETILLNENDSLSDYKVKEGSEIRISRQKEEWRPRMTK